MPHEAAASRKRALGYIPLMGQQEPPTTFELVAEDGGRILVVDDDPGMRDLVALHLRNAGYEVQVAEDAVDAARQILKRLPELIIVDVEMPHWNGLDFAATVRADTTIPYIPIIAMTAHQPHAQRAKSLGVDCLIKPFVKDKLLMLVAHSLDRAAKSQVDAGVRPRSGGTLSAAQAA